MVQGAKLILANQYLIEERKVPAASIGNRGTGMYEILDPEAMRRGGLAAFLKAIRDSSEPDHGMVSVLVAETDVELLPRVNFASSSEALDYYLAETPLGTRGEGDRW